MAKGVAKAITKSELINLIVDAASVPKKDVRGVLEAFIELGHQELKKKGLFVVPGFVKLSVSKKPATKERPGVNPFTGEKIIIKAKPAKKVVRARPVKAVKDVVA